MSMQKKFELTAETKVVPGRTLYRIHALIAFGNVDKGDMGGWVEKEDNLDQTGNAWVSGDARVYGDARVSGDAWVSQNTHYLLICPIGSRNDFTTFFRNKKRGISVTCGCFNGSIEEFEAAVKRNHGGNKHGSVYRLAIEMARAQIDLTDGETVEVSDD